jgi:hypothetical protein
MFHFGSAPFCDEAHGWQCTGTADTKDQKFAHVESVKLWFLENPHYEERASRPHLCTDLQGSAKPDVTVTFDVWGNRLQGCMDTT